MRDAVFCSINLIFCLAGLFSVIWHIFCHIMCKKDCRDIITVVMSNNHSELPDKVYTAMLLSRHRNFGKRDVFVIDTDIPSHIKILCRTCAENMGKVHFVTQKEISDIFQNNH